jgi:hypothetical protein
MSALGPKRQFVVVQHNARYGGKSGRAADAVSTARPDPSRTSTLRCNKRDNVHLHHCKRPRLQRAKEIASRKAGRYRAVTVNVLAAILRGPSGSPWRKSA